MARRLDEVDEALIRGVPLNTCLSSFGRHFRRARDVDNYALSRATNKIDHFLSHDWATSGFIKFLCLVWAFNARAAFVATCVVSTSVGVLRIYGAFGASDGWWTVCFGWLTFIFFLFFWHDLRACFRPSPLVFLDVLCISQTDAKLKRAGILGLAGFLGCSDELNILWSPHWSRRLWCVFELAAFLRDSRSAANIKFMPVKMASVLSLQCVCAVLVTVMHGLVMDVGNSGLGAHEGIGTSKECRWELATLFLTMLGVVVALLLLILPSFMHLGQGIMRDLGDLPGQLKQFDLHEVKCTCCSLNHIDPRTGATIPCDRVLVLATLREWFGGDGDSYLESFNRMVRQELSGMVANTGGIALPFEQALWAALGIQLPWLADFLPWWAASELRGWQWFLWFLRGLMAVSANLMLWLVMMRVSILLWAASVPFVKRAYTLPLSLLQTLLLLVIAVCYCLPFRWCYVMSDENSLWPGVPLAMNLAFLIAIFRHGLCQEAAAPPTTPQMTPRQSAHGLQVTIGRGQSRTTNSSDDQADQELCSTTF